MSDQYPQVVSISAGCNSRSNGFDTSKGTYVQSKHVSSDSKRRLAGLGSVMPHQRQWESDALPAVSSIRTQSNMAVHGMA